MYFRKLLIKLTALAFLFGITMTAPAIAGSHKSDKDHKSSKYEKKEHKANKDDNASKDDNDGRKNKRR